MVPLDDRRTVLDWMEAMALPVILVCGSYLEAISHALSALDVLVQHRLSIAAIVVNETEGSTVDLRETAQTLARFAGPRRLYVVPRVNPSAPHHWVFGQIAATL